ncbi:MAG: hypothetical protein KGI30_04200, partial [Planctomycetota bacterium]|nr:hypothetical protein [Planctomycetota bacterium]
ILCKKRCFLVFSRVCTYCTVAIHVLEEQGLGHSLDISMIASVKLQHMFWKSEYQQQYGVDGSASPDPPYFKLDCLWQRF